MKKSSTFLFVFFLLLALVFLVAVNFLKDYAYISDLGYFGVITISILLVSFIIFLFVYREVENNKTLNQFITIVTHKIKTPLTGIRWSIVMLQKDVSLTEKNDMLIEMKKANDRLMEIMDLLVGFAKFDSKLDHALETTSFTDIINDSVSKNTANVKNKNIQFSVDSNTELPKIEVDKAKIQFAVDMLVDNAIKYTPIGGKISASFVVENGSIILKIMDNGIGMSYFDKKKLFRHFFRAKNAQLVDAGGLGLGLYTAKKIVQHNGGKLWADSEGINKGSTFYISFPIKS